MSTRSRLLLCAVFTVFLTATVRGQSSLLAGTVKDQNSAAVSGARVTAQSDTGGPTLAVMTNDEGSFTFNGLRAGRYILRVLAEGFGSSAQQVDMPTLGVKDLAITLTVGEQRTTVTAEIGQVEDVRDVAQPVSVINTESIRERATSVLAQAGEEEAGLNLQRTSPTLGSIVVRGLTGKNVVNYVDGVRYTHGGQRGGINAFFNLNDASVFESIEVLRGPNGAQYGSDSLAGTVNLISRSPVFGASELHGEITPHFNTADRSYGSSGLFSYGGLKFAGYVNINGRRVGNLRTADGIDSHSAITRFLGLPSTILFDVNPDTGFQQYGGSAKLAYSPRSDQQLIFFYQRGQQDDGKRFDQLVGGDGNLIADLRNLMLDFAYVRFVKQGLGFFDSASFAASYNSQREERVNQGGQGDPFGDITHQYERTSVWGFSFFLDKRLGGHNNFLIGADAYRERVNAPAYTVNGTTFAVTLSRPRVPDEARFNSAGVFVQDQWNAIPDRLRITGALRYGGGTYTARAADAPNVGGRRLWPDDSLITKAFSGRIGAVIRATNELRIALNYGRGFRYPHITDLGTLGLTGDGFEVDHIASGALGGTIGTTVGADAVSTGIPVSKQRSEYSNNFDAGVRFQGKRVDMEFTAFRLDINDAIVKQALILPPGAVGQTLGSDTIISQSPNGVVFVAASANPVLVRANFTDAKITGVEFETEVKLKHDLQFRSAFTYTKAEEKATGIPPNIEGGTPPATIFLSLRKNWSRFWIEGYATFAGRQDRFSIGDIADRRTGATRTRAQIENYFRRGACVLGLTSNAAGTCNANVATYTLRATGENITQVLTRVLGPGFPTRPLFTALPGYGIANVRGGVTLNENASVFMAFENILDQFHRNASWGIDGAGRSFTGQLRLRF